MNRLALAPLQRRFETLYGLERSVDIDAFVRFSDECERETLLLRVVDDSLEIRLQLPLAAGGLKFSAAGLRPESVAEADLWAQVIEGLSHFMLLAERARVELPTTHLELELQAEVDKYVFLAAALDAPDQRLRLREQLYSSVRFIHAEDGERGSRYRFANRLAARYIAALDPCFCSAQTRRRLRRFFRAGQAEKIALAQAA